MRDIGLPLREVVLPEQLILLNQKFVTVIYGMFLGILLQDFQAYIQQRRRLQESSTFVQMREVWGSSLSYAY